MADASEKTLLTDDEIRQRMMEDPEIRSHVEEVLRQVKDGGSGDAGIGPEELQDFLRDFSQGMEPR